MTFSICGNEGHCRPPCYEWMTLLGLYLALSGIFSCSSLPSKPQGPVPWAGRFIGADHRYDLYLEAPDPEEPDLIDVYFIPPGKSKDDSESLFRLFRIRGDRAKSTHVRRILENDCPMEMVRGIEGIQLIDRCGGTIDLGGFYQWHLDKGRDK